MLIIAGTVTVEPDERETFLEDRARSSTEIRKEPGCLQYGYSADVADLGRCLFISIWENEESFDTHAEIVRSREDTGRIEVRERILVRYDVSRVSKVGE